MSDGGTERIFDPGLIHIKALPCIKIASDPYIMKCCIRGETVRAYTSVFARLAGPDIHVVECDEWAAERALLGYSTEKPRGSLIGSMPMTGALDNMGGQHPALNSAIGRNAVLVKDVGAVCAGHTEKEAEAVARAVSLNCAAACNDRYEKPLGRIDAIFKRQAYLLKTSGAGNKQEKENSDI